MGYLEGLEKRIRNGNFFHAISFRRNLYSYPLFRLVCSLPPRQNGCEGRISARYLIRNRAHTGHHWIILFGEINYQNGESRRWRNSQQYWWRLLFSHEILARHERSLRYKILPPEQKAKSYFYEPIYNFSLVLLPAFEESDFYKKLKEKEMAPIQVSERHSE
jgi:hypothetical protein